VVLAHAVVRTILTLTPIHEEKKKKMGGKRGEREKYINPCTAAVKPSGKKHAAGRAEVVQTIKKNC
jgi:hypothetical protein